MYNRLPEIQLKGTFSALFQIEKNEVLHYLREIPGQTKYVGKSFREKIWKCFKKMPKFEIFLNFKEELLRTDSYFIDENAGIIRGISFRLSNVDLKRIIGQYELNEGNLVNCIIKTTFKNKEIAILLTNKIENFLRLSIAVKKKECIVNVEYHESTIKSSLITTLTKELFFLKDAIEEKKKRYANVDKTPVLSRF
jgi:hypothetical protein